MDDEKSVLEKVTDSVKGAVETIVDAAKSMASPESGTPIGMPHNESGAEIERAARTEKRPAKKAPSPDPERVAGTTNEQVYIPEATDAAATPAPLFPKKRSAAPARANKRVAKAKKAAAQEGKKVCEEGRKKGPEEDEEIGCQKDRQENFQEESREATALTDRPRRRPPYLVSLRWMTRQTFVFCRLQLIRRRNGRGMVRTRMRIA